MSDAAVLEDRGSGAPRLPDDAPDTPPPGPYAELAEMAGGFIHDIKNHLGTLSLNLQLLAEDFDDPQTPRERKALERVTRLHGECQKLVELSNDFLRFARTPELNKHPTPLDAVVARMIDFLAPTARQRGIEIVWYPAPDLPPVDLDRDLFEQALLNLLLNAEQAMPDGGTLTLIGRAGSDSGSDGRSDSESESGRERQEGLRPVSDSAVTATPTVTLEVIDTGCGMAADVLAKVFRPFHTTKKDGNGLGLLTARKVVLAHGGTIDVQSEPGRGTKFTIKLPAAR